MNCKCGHTKHVHYKLKDGSRSCFARVFDIEDDDPCVCTNFEK